MKKLVATQKMLALMGAMVFSIGVSFAANNSCINDGYGVLCGNDNQPQSYLKSSTPQTKLLAEDNNQEGNQKEDSED